MYKFIAISLATILLAGCGSDPFGLHTKRSPDEFAVLPHAKPLEYPTSVELKSPEELKKYVKKKSQTDVAKSVFGEPSNGLVSGPSTNSDDFVNTLTQGQKTDPNIRQEVAEESNGKRGNLTPIGRKLLFWKDDPKDTAGTVLDPTEEAKKLKAKAIPHPTKQ